MKPAAQDPHFYHPHGESIFLDLNVQNKLIKSINTISGITHKNVNIRDEFCFSEVHA